MTRKKIQPDVPVLALRRAEAAASIGVSIDTFDRHVRFNVPCVRLGSTVIYPVAGLNAWVEQNASILADDLRVRADYPARPAPDEPTGSGPFGF